MKVKEESEKVGLKLNIQKTDHGTETDWKVYGEKPAAGLMRVPLYVTSCFSLAASKILSLFSTFDKLMSLWVSLDSSYWELYCILLFGRLCPFPKGSYWLFFFPSHFSALLNFPILFWTPVIWILVHLVMSHKSFTVFSYFHSFSFLYLFLLLWLDRFLSLFSVFWSFLHLTLVFCWSFLLYF